MKRLAPVGLAALAVVCAGCGSHETPTPTKSENSRFIMESVSAGPLGAYLIDVDGTVWWLVRDQAKEVKFPEPPPGAGAMDGKK